MPHPNQAVLFNNVNNPTYVLRPRSKQKPMAAYEVPNGNLWGPPQLATETAS
jgi:hypothetical protein